MIDIGFLLIAIGSLLVGGFCVICATVVVGAFLYTGWKSRNGGGENE